MFNETISFFNNHFDIIDVDFSGSLIENNPLHFKQYFHTSMLV